MDSSKTEGRETALNEQPGELDAVTEAASETAPALMTEPAPGPAAPEPRPRGGWLAGLGVVFALLWAGGAGAYLWGYHLGGDISGLTPAQLGGFAVFAVAPALLFLMTGFLARELARTAHNARRMDMALARLIAPAAAAEGEVHTLSSAVMLEVGRVNAALESALARLAAMEEVIAHHADALERSAGDARERAETLLAGLREERLRLSEVSESLDDKAALIAEAISEQSKMVAAAAELAESQASESEKRILSGAGRLAEAGETALENSERAARALKVGGDDLRHLAEALRERSEGLDAAYLRHRDKLKEAAETLRKEQEKIAAALDFHRAEVEVMAKTAREGADGLNAAAHKGAVAFRETVDAAIARANDVAGAVRREAEAADRIHQESLERLKTTAEEAQAVSDAAMKAIDAQTQRLSLQVEKMGETAFEAVRRADENFQSRLAEADRLTARASAAADEAAEAVRARLETVLEAARTEARRVEQEIAALGDRLAALPDAARVRSEETMNILRRGLEGLNAAAQTAAEEAQEIDAAFQARIRQNYELLSDFMLRMGSVAGGRRPPELKADELPDPLSQRRKRDDETPGTAPPVGEAPASPRESRREQPVGFPERGRAQEPGWRWKDLLATMTPGEAPSGETEGAEGEAAKAARDPAEAGDRTPETKR
ncbi:MAG: hypothetical protein KIS81_12095 [Maricaulaceae bacterium]|nr:hypothetical protein [Maricaulaceae bacterium]